MGSTIAPLRAAGAASALPADGEVLDEAPHRRGRGRFTGALLLGSALALLAFGVAAWTLAPKLYVRPDGARAQLQDPTPGAVRQELRRAALRLAEPVNIRRR